MSITQFPRDLYIKRLDTSEEGQCGSISPAEDIELDSIKVWIHIKGAPAGSETIQIKMYGEPTYSNLLFSSTAHAISGITAIDSLSTTDYLGWIKCDFNRQNLNKDLTYYPAVTLANYTRNADTYYIGLVYDWPDGTYHSATTINTAPIAMQIFGYHS